MPPETKYFQNNRCLVTSTRAVFDNVTYAMANITSVRGHKEDPNRMPVVIFGGLGAMAIWGAIDKGKFGLLVLGIPLIAVAIAILRKQKPTYTVILGTAGMETHAMSGQDGKEVRAIINAIEKAIVERG